MEVTNREFVGYLIGLISGVMLTFVFLKAPDDGPKDSRPRN